MQKKPTTERDQSRKAEDRWTKRIIEGGWTPVAQSFLEHYAELKPGIGLSSQEAMLVIQLISYKWGERAPYPSFKVLAKRMGLKTDTVRKLAAALEGKKFLKRQIRQGYTNKFDLNPLFLALEEAISRTENARRIKKPRLAATA